LGFEKNANFFAENGQKSQKIAIITSTPNRLFLRKNFPKIYLGQVAWSGTYIGSRFGNSLDHQFATHHQLGRELENQQIDNSTLAHHFYN
jgi:hypothetical protein